MQCTKSNINKLRHLIQQNSSVFDAGYIISYTGYCTANWGKIEPTKLDSKTRGEVNGYRFYSNEKNLYQMPNHYNITVKGNFFVVNITVPHSFLLNTMSKHYFQIYSKNNDYIFDEFMPESSTSGVFFSKLMQTYVVNVIFIVLEHKMITQGFFITVEMQSC